MLDAANVSLQISYMVDELRTQRWMFRWALPASVVVHLLIGALLIFGLPVSLSQSQEEQAIEVDLVPPPEPVEKAEAEPPPAAKEPEKPQEESAAVPAPASNDPARNSPSPVLQPVIQFGEKDDGPRESPNGDSTEDGSASPTASEEPDKQDVAEPPVATALNATGQTSQPEMPTPTPKPANAVKAQEPVGLKEAKTLFSQSATGGLTAMTAMNDVPRDARAGRLCLTELRQQLLNASPPYFPELLPSDRLKNGTVIEIPREAFRASGQWYNLSYRCEVDAEATKVVSFAFRVGDQIPRSEWNRRGLPSQ